MFGPWMEEDKDDEFDNLMYLSTQTLVSMLRKDEKEINSLRKSRKKWRYRYYKMKNKNKNLQKTVDQIYDNYQDIGEMALDYSEKLEQKDKIIDLMAEKIFKEGIVLKYEEKDKEEVKQYFENKAKEKWGSYMISEGVKNILKKDMKKYKTLVNITEGETQRIYDEIYLCIEELLEEIEFTKDNWIYYKKMIK